MSLPSIFSMCDKLLESIFGYSCSYAFSHAFLLKDPETPSRDATWYLVKSDFQAMTQIHEQTACDEFIEKIQMYGETGLGEIRTGDLPVPRSFSDLEKTVNVGRQPGVKRVRVVERMEERLDEISDKKVVPKAMKKFMEFVNGKGLDYDQGYLRDAPFKPSMFTAGA